MLHVILLCYIFPLFLIIILLLSQHRFENDMIPSWKTMRSTKLISPTKFLLVVMGVIVAIQIISYKIYDGSFRSRNETTDERKFLEALVPGNTATTPSSFNSNQSVTSKQTVASTQTSMKTLTTNESNYVATKRESEKTTHKETYDNTSKQSNVKTDKTNQSNYIPVVTKTETEKSTPKETHDIASKQANVKTDKTNQSKYIATKTETEKTTPKETHEAIQVEKKIPQVIIVGAQKGVRT